MLGDFGTARSNFQRCSTFIGTKYYVAPEVIGVMKMSKKPGNQQTYYTSACDMWSCGVVLYALLRFGIVVVKKKKKKTENIVFCIFGGCWFLAQTDF